MADAGYGADGRSSCGWYLYSQANVSLELVEPQYPSSEDILPFMLTFMPALNLSTYQKPRLSNTAPAQLTLPLSLIHRIFARA